MHLQKVLRALDKQAPGSAQYAQIIELYQARVSMATRPQFEALLQDSQVQLCLLTLFETLIAKERTRLESKPESGSIMDARATWPAPSSSLAQTSAPSSTASEARNDRRLLHALLLLLHAAPESTSLSLYQTMALHVSVMSSVCDTLVLFSVNDYKILQTMIKLLAKGIDACQLLRTGLLQSPTFLSHLIVVVNKILLNETNKRGPMSHAKLILRVLTLFKRLVRTSLQESTESASMWAEQSIAFFNSFSLILEACSMPADLAIADNLLDILIDVWQWISSSHAANQAHLTMLPPPSSESAGVFQALGTLLELFGTMPIETRDSHRKIIKLLEGLLSSNLNPKHLKSSVVALEAQCMPLSLFLKGMLSKMDAALETMTTESYNAACVLKAFRILKRIFALLPLSAPLFDSIHLHQCYSNKYLHLYQTFPKITHYLLDLLYTTRSSVPLFYHCVTRDYFTIVIDLFCFYSATVSTATSQPSAVERHDALLLTSLEIIGTIFSFKEFIPLVLHHPLFFDRFIGLFMALSSTRRHPVVEPCQGLASSTKTMALLDLVLKCMYHWGSKPLFSEALLSHCDGQLILCLSRLLNQTTSAANKALCEKCLFRLLAHSKAGSVYADTPLCYYLLRPFLETRIMKSINEVGIRILKIEIENVQSSCPPLFSSTADSVQSTVPARPWTPYRIFKEATAALSGSLLLDQLGHAEPCFKEESHAYALSYLTYLWLSQEEKGIELRQEPPLAMQYATHGLSDPSAYSEIQFVVGLEGTSVCCHLGLLAAHSTLFQMLADLEDPAPSVDLPLVRADHLKILIQSLYSDSMLGYLRSLPLATGCLLDLYALANAFQLIELEQNIVLLVWERASQSLDQLSVQDDALMALLSYDRFEWLCWMEPTFVSKMALLYLLRFPYYTTHGYCEQRMDRIRKCLAEPLSDNRVD